MKHSDPASVSSDMEPAPTPIPEIDGSPVRTGDRAGIHAFVVSAYELHHAELFDYLARTTRDRSVAEDLLQETYVRLMKEAREGRSPLEVRGWLYRVASSLVIGRARRQTTASRWLGRNRRSEHEGMVPPAPESGALGRERATEMERVLEGLSADARLALLLSGQGFAGEEIAAAIGRSAAATRILLCRARARVRIRRELFAEEAR
jgi:RNA polymerase sigma-70 factor (ECF subfamily)